MLSKPQPNLNTRLGLIMKWLTRFWWNFKGSCEHLEQIPTVMVTFVQASFVLATFVHIRSISGPDFDETLKIGSWENLEQIQTVTVTFVQINIFPGDICPYQEYLSCYWPNFDETWNVASWENLEHIQTVTVTFVQSTFVQVTFFHIRNISAVTDPILMKL